MKKFHRLTMLLLAATAILLINECRKKPGNPFGYGVGSRFSHHTSTVVDPDLTYTYDQMDYLALSLCMLGSDTSVCDVDSFKINIAKLYYGSLNPLPLADEVDELRIMTANIYMDSSFFKPKDDMASAMIKEINKPANAPLIRSGSPSPNDFDSGFVENFSLKQTSTGIATAMYSYITIPHASPVYFGVNFSNLPLVVIPKKDFLSDSVGGVPNNDKPIKGYIYDTATHQLDTVTFEDEDDIFFKQYVDYYIWVVNFDHIEFNAEEGGANCDYPKICGDNYCDRGCGEDTINCGLDCIANPTYKLRFNAVTIEGDIRDKRVDPTIHLRESFLAAHYKLAYSFLIVHPNGKTELVNCRNLPGAWERNQVKRTRIAANGDSSSHGTNNTQSKSDIICNHFNIEGPNDSKLYIMFYESDYRLKENIELHYDHAGHTGIENLKYTVAKWEWPYSPLHKNLNPQPNNVEPIGGTTFNHIVEIRGTDFTLYPSGYFYHHNGSPGPSGTGYGVSFTLWATKN